MHGMWTKLTHFNDREKTETLECHGWKPDDSLTSRWSFSFVHGTSTQLTSIRWFPAMSLVSHP